MPFVEIGDLRTHYELTGDNTQPVLMLSNSLGTNLSMWDTQLSELEKSFRILRYDTRGHGQSSVTPGDYTFEQLGRDLLNLLDALHFDRAHFCGLSIGWHDRHVACNSRAQPPASSGALEHCGSHRHKRDVERAHRNRTQGWNEVRGCRCHRALVHARVSCIVP